MVVLARRAICAAALALCARPGPGFADEIALFPTTEQTKINVKNAQSKVQADLANSQRRFDDAAQKQADALKAQKAISVPNPFEEIKNQMDADEAKKQRLRETAVRPSSECMGSNSAVAAREDRLELIVTSQRWFESRSQVTESSLHRRRRRRKFRVPPIGGESSSRASRATPRCGTPTRPRRVWASSRSRRRSAPRQETSLQVCLTQISVATAMSASSQTTCAVTPMGAT